MKIPFRMTTKNNVYMLDYAVDYKQFGLYSILKLDKEFHIYIWNFGADTVIEAKERILREEYIQENKRG